MKPIVSLFSVCLLLSTSVLAAEVVADLRVYKVSERTDGTKLFEPGDRARPGDILEYRLVYRNTGKTTARNLASTLPIPAVGIEYLADSALPRVLWASTDGKDFSPVPLTRLVALPNGNQVRQLVPSSEYRFLRWPLGDLPAGASVAVTARVRINDHTNPALAAR